MTSLRIASTTDLDTLLGFVAAYYAHDHLAFEPEAMRRSLGILVQDPSLGRACLIEQEGNAVGYTIFTFGFDAEFGGRLATVTDFFLAADSRAAGLGAAAVAEVEALCRSLGVLAIELQVIRGNNTALAFWARRGFEQLDRIPMSKPLT